MRKGLFLQPQFKEIQPIELEKWQSGRMHWSWKPAYWEVPGVRIPPSPQNNCPRPKAGTFFIIKGNVSNRFIDTSIQFKANQYNKWVYIDKYHYNKKCSDRSIKFIVWIKIFNINSEPISRYNTQYSCNRTSGWEESPLRSLIWSKIINGAKRKVY